LENKEMKNILGKGITIPMTAILIENKSGMKREYAVDTVEVLIGIGKDHTASLIMDSEALKALQAGEEINIETIDN
jgi:hypothetical protein